jgi:polyhydroxyalkanoate synthesis regulator phasin
MADPPNRGVAEALREAIERTLSVAGRPARTGSAALTGERATELLDELVRRGREARDELARRARRGLGARDELANRIEALERRLSALEDALRTKPKPKAED